MRESASSKCILGEIVPGSEVVREIVPCNEVVGEIMPGSEARGEVSGSEVGLRLCRVVGQIAG